MNRRQFLKSAGVAIAAVALKIKGDAQEIDIGVGRRSPLLSLSNFGLCFEIENDDKTFRVVTTEDGIHVIEKGYEHLSCLYN